MPPRRPQVGQRLPTTCQLPLRRYVPRHWDEEPYLAVVRAVWAMLPDRLPGGGASGSARTALVRVIARHLEEAGLHYGRTSRPNGARYPGDWLPLVWRTVAHLARIGALARVGSRGAGAMLVKLELPEDPLAIPARAQALAALRRLVLHAPRAEDGRALVDPVRALCLLDALAV